MIDIPYLSTATDIAIVLLCLAIFCTVLTAVFLVLNVGRRIEKIDCQQRKLIAMMVESDRKMDENIKENGLFKP
jgi:uncharacterized membrane protein